MPLVCVTVPFGNREFRRDAFVKTRDAVKTSKFTEERVACALKEAEPGMSVAAVCRKMGNG
ncbi:transposase [Burkholderia contaminans]|uniref:transposase n=1 Tax=Burkholderia contaminans TaxID=488447 RepID=UPI003BF9A606